MDLGFHRSSFRSRHHEMITKVASIGFLASRFLTLSAFAASSPSLLLGMFLLLVPKDGFFLLGHRVVELGIIPSRSDPFSAWMHTCAFVRTFGVTVRIQIDTFDFFILFTFLDRRETGRQAS
ncbi:hypothetical protein DY000_02015975 [Brassica cretica]|uniref:Uncharacterized protein n=1 Tax=Brassica cretica TaxID=69181 RepID=A0ABQ7CMN5_BRACR|nr:hypothetical protein DY000_02015975 [Brassica cretica]